MKITWLGHACFRLDSAGGSAVIDPFRDGYCPDYADIRETADAVYTSHGHGDHNASECVTLTGRKPGFAVTEVASFHDDENGAKRGANIIRVFEDEGIRVCHLGDLGHLLSEEQIKSIGKLDAVMIPVGGFYTIDAATAYAQALALGAKVVIPMHYRMSEAGSGVLSPLAAFTDFCSDVREYPEGFIEITKDTEPHTAILAYVARG